jgi:Polyketide cyclase / dehydrase and lipid transport
MDVNLFAYRLSRGGATLPFKSQSSSHSAKRWIWTSLFFAQFLIVASRGDTSWQEIGRSADVTLLTRERGGSSIKELRGVGEIDAPLTKVKRVLNEVDSYPQFMPYTSEARVLSRDSTKHTVLQYMRLNPPIIGPRDFTIVVHDDQSSDERYVSRWEQANDLGPPAAKGITRVKINEGSWLLESIDGGKKTQATYTVYTDGGGDLPSFIVNLANKKSVVDLIVAVRKQVNVETER